MDPNEEKQRLIRIVILAAGLPLLIVLACCAFFVYQIGDEISYALKETPSASVKTKPTVADLSATNFPNVYQAELTYVSDLSASSVRCCEGTYVMIDGAELGFAKHVLRSAPVYVTGKGTLSFSYADETGMEHPLIMYASEANLEDLQELETQKNADKKTVTAKTVGNGVYWVIDYDEWLRIWGVTYNDGRSTLYENTSLGFSVQIPYSFPYRESTAEAYTDAYGITHEPLLELEPENAAIGAYELTVEQLSGKESFHEYISAYKSESAAEGAELPAARQEHIGPFAGMYYFAERWNTDGFPVKRLTGLYEMQGKYILVRYAYDDNVGFYTDCFESLRSFTNTNPEYN